MASLTPRSGTSWLLTVRNVVIRNVARTGADADPPVVAYEFVHNGVAYLTGTMEWEPVDAGIEDAWGVEFLLPPTQGILKANVTVTLGNAVGKDTQSIKVVQR